MTLEDIASFKNSFISAVYRALRAGIDVGFPKFSTPLTHSIIRPRELNISS
jgi:hypothetical protein